MVHLTKSIPMQAAVITEVVATEAVAATAADNITAVAVIPIIKAAVADIVAGFRAHLKDLKPIRHSVPKSS